MEGRKAPPGGYKMKARRYALLFAATLAFSGLAFATISAGGVNSALCQIKDLVVAVLPTLALILFFLAGIAYAAGQAFGAETKAKAQGWAMSMLVGGIIGILLAVIAPVIVGAFVGSLSNGSLAC